MAKIDDFIRSKLDDFKRTVQSKSSYFNPTSNGGNNFWSTPVAQGLANTQRAVQSAPKQSVKQAQGLWQGLNEPYEAPYTNSTSGYTIGRSISGGALTPVTAPIQMTGKLISHIPEAVKTLQTWGPTNRAIEQRQKATEREIASNPLYKKNPKLAEAKRFGDQYITGGILFGNPGAERNFKNVDLKKAFHPEDEQIMRDFASQVGMSAQAGRKSLGELGQNANAVLERYFGRKFSEELTNKQVQQLFDYTLAKIDNARAGRSGGALAIKPKSFTPPIGLQAREAEGLAQQGLKSPPPESKISNFKKRLSGLNQITTESRTLLKKLGSGGEDIANRIDEMYNNAERMAGGAVSRYKQVVQSLTPQEAKNVFRFLDAGDINLSEKEIKAANVLRQELNTYAQEAQNANMSIRLPGGGKVDWQPRESYFPHVLDTQALKAKRESVVAHLVQSKQFPNVETANNFVRDIVDGKPAYDIFSRYFNMKAPSRFGSLELARMIDWPKEVLRYDKNVLPEYFERAANRIHQSKNFGPSNELVDTLLSQVARDGGDPTVAKEIVEQNLGLNRGSKSLSQGIGALKQAEAFLKLPFAAISNAGQSVNTATVYGIKRTIKNIVESARPESRQFALETGAILDDALRSFQEEQIGKGRLGKLTSPGFKQVERFNRVVAANTGKTFALDRFQSLLENPQDIKARGDLEKFGIKIDEALANGALSKEDLTKAGQKAVNMTQFKTRPIDLPPTWNTTFGKLASQFKSFSFKQGQFLNQQVFKPIAQGNIAPLLRFILLGTVIGEGIADVKAAVRLRQRPNSLSERLADNIAAVGGGGTLQDAVNAAMRGPEAMERYIMGPVASDVADILGNTGLAATGVQQLAQGDPKGVNKFKPLERQLLRNVPFVGQPLSNAVFPPRNAYKSRTPDLPQEVIGLEPTKQQSITGGEDKSVQAIQHMGIFDFMKAKKDPILTVIEAARASKLDRKLTQDEVGKVQGYVTQLKKAENQAKQSGNTKAYNNLASQRKFLQYIVTITPKPTSNVIEQAEQDTKNKRTVVRISKDEKLSQKQKEILYKSLGTTSSQAEFDRIRALDNTHTAPIVHKILTDRQYKQDKVNTFIDQKILTPALIDVMVDQSLLTQNQGTQLKSYIKLHLSTSKGSGKIGRKKGRKIKYTFDSSKSTYEKYKAKPIKLKTASVKLKTASRKLKSLRPKKYH